MSTATAARVLPTEHLPLAVRDALAAAVTAAEADPATRATSDMLRCAACGSSCFHILIDGSYVCRFVSHHEPAPVVGMGASLLYVTDTQAMVITRVTATTLVAAQVETGPAEVEEWCDPGAHGLRPTREAGILDRIIPGTERRFTRTKNGTYRSNGQRLRIGASYSRTDWRL
jgi:hypothetical protein